MDSRIVVGLDSGSTTAIGWAVLNDGEHLASGTFRPVEDVTILDVVHPGAGEEDSVERDRAAFRRVAAIWKFGMYSLWPEVHRISGVRLSWPQVACLGTEWPMGSRGNPRTDVLLGVAFGTGIIIAVMHGVRLMAVHQQTVKATGFSKDDMGACEMLVGSKLGSWSRKKDGDRADAIGVAVHTNRVVRLDWWIQEGRMTP